MSFTDNNSSLPYLATSNVFSEDPSQFLVDFTSLYTNIANAVNLREVGQFETIEILTGQIYFDPTNAQIKRSVFRKVFTTGIIASGATSTQAHGITGFTTLTFVHIYGTCITTAATFNKRPIPYASATLVTDQIQVDVDDTNLRIINGATAPQISSSIIVLEYVKD